jgi:hypothetical protein
VPSAMPPSRTAAISTARAARDPLMELTSSMIPFADERVVRNG